MLKVSHTKPLHDATALMADEAWTQNKQSVHAASVVVRGEGIVRFWEGWFGCKGGDAFEKAVSGGAVK